MTPQRKSFFGIFCVVKILACLDSTTDSNSAKNIGIWLSQLRCDLSISFQIDFN